MINTIDGIIAAAQGGTPGVIAVAAAHDQPVIEAVAAARREGIATPILVGHVSEIEAMLTSSQRHVNGTAILQLRPLGFSTVGVESADDLVKTKFGEYGETQKGWTADDAKGFIKVLSTPLRVFYANHADEQ